MRSIPVSVVSQATPSFPRIGGVACETSAAYQLIELKVRGNIKGCGRGSFLVI